MKYRVTSLFRFSLLDRLSDKDRRGKIIRQATEKEAVDYLNKILGLNCTITELVII